MKVRNVTITRSHVSWGGPKGDWYWFYWWNWLPKKYRYLGYDKYWYDGPLYHFGFWFFNWSWNYNPFWKVLQFKEWLVGKFKR